MSLSEEGMEGYRVRGHVKLIWKLDKHVWCFEYTVHFLAFVLNYHISTKLQEAFVRYQPSKLTFFLSLLSLFFMITYVATERKWKIWLSSHFAHRKGIYCCILVPHLVGIWQTVIALLMIIHERRDEYWWVGR